ncbi:carbamoyltransferase HypF [Marinobacter salinus]|uniref:Carbamoyltransferase HypF n=1 Tax=Marinobacter salinus TaxID=1874317 RepID=A0A1D9GGY2_9GAMM|nr:carbamoyltransferase HypF [Marinobacter salinus]AOY86863.1 carbamoyltransferase HypF [Marinobacter salinus]
MTQDSTAEPPLTRWRVCVRGIVQGVGFRPFVYRQATDLGVTGWVGNSPEGVEIEAEGHPLVLKQLVSALIQHAPANARIDDVHTEPVAHPGAFREFSIRESQKRGEASAQLPADWATCQQCLQELYDPDNRRYRYPFINCTDCGPRYSLIEALPYDRANTAMKHFQMCGRCLEEYHDPASRRFHAEAAACPDCGPHLAFCRSDGDTLAEGGAALAVAVSRLAAGEIIALKGVGGFQLLVDARKLQRVQRLRERKGRPDKPLAVMFGSMESLQVACPVTEQERQLLAGPERPIVLLHTRNHGLADNIAPGRSELGVMLPSTPLHELLLRDLGFPVVATSGNRSGEPIAIDNSDARARLADIADGFLVHDRSILRPLDDSVAHVVAGRPQLLRRARGYSPNLFLSFPMLPGWGATGGHLKTTVALSTDAGVVLSQHLGDMDSVLGREGFEHTVDSLQGLFATRVQCWAHDDHPDYYTTRRAQEMGPVQRPVQHHVAHIAAVMAEHGIREPILGVAWDGSGLGEDQTLWGGEFLRVDSRGYKRLAHLRRFPLPGGEAAAREPRRSALGILYALMGEPVMGFESLLPVSDFSRAERKLLLQALKSGLNAPETSSIGRLFDAVAALVGIRQKASYEGQAAAELEAMQGCEAGARAYKFGLSVPGADRPWQVDWEPVIQGILADIARSAPVSEISAAFQQALVNVIVRVAKRAELSRIALGGGCFQNACLLGTTVTALNRAGFQVFWPCQVPPNDGGLALGQLAWASRVHQNREALCVWPYQDV